MEKINDLFEAKVTKTIEAYPSIFSKDDVVELLNDLKTNVLNAVHDMLPQPSAYMNDEKKFDEFSQDVKNCLEQYLDNSSNEVINYDSAEFCLTYDRRIELEDIELNSCNIIEELDSILIDKWKEFYGEVEENE
jgi:hypothetical protein